MIPVARREHRVAPESTLGRLADLRRTTCTRDVLAPKQTQHRHKGEVDTTAYDLRLLYAKLIAQIRPPARELVEVLDGRRFVQADMTVREEALVLLMSHHPEPVTVAAVKGSMDRRNPGSVSNALSQLWRDKLLHRDSKKRVVLTEAGLREAIQVAQAHVA